MVLECSIGILFFLGVYRDNGKMEATVGTVQCMEGYIGNEGLWDCGLQC